MLLSQSIVWHPKTQPPSSCFLLPLDGVTSPFPPHYVVCITYCVLCTYSPSLALHQLIPPRLIKMPSNSTDNCHLCHPCDLLQLHQLSCSHHFKQSHKRRKEIKSVWLYWTNTVKSMALVITETSHNHPGKLSPTQTLADTHTHTHTRKRTLTSSPLHGPLGRIWMTLLWELISGSLIINKILPYTA